MMLIEATIKMVLDKPAILALCHFHFVFYSQTVEGGSPLNIQNSYRYSHLAKFKWCFQTIQLAPHKFQQHFDLRSLNSPRHISRCIFPAFCTRQHSIKNSSRTVKEILIRRKIHTITNFLAVKPSMGKLWCAFWKFQREFCLKSCGLCAFWRIFHGNVKSSIHTRESAKSAGLPFSAGFTLDASLDIDQWQDS